MIALFVAVHTVLYFLWKIPAERERNTRSDGKLIPRYYTGGIGDVLGLTLVSVAAGLVTTTLSYTSIVVIIIAVVCTIFLRRLWVADARRRTVSLYFRSGTETLAGIAHLVYMVFVLTTVGLFIINHTTSDASAIAIFGVGVFIYLASALADKLRGII